MVAYRCDGCGKKFDHKSDYTKHIKRKNPCKSGKVDNNDEDIKCTKDTREIHKDTQIGKKNVKNDWKCTYCKKSFTTNSSYNRHMSKFCKVKREQDNAKEDLLQKLIEQMNKQNEHMNKQNEQMNKQNAKIDQMAEIISKLKSENTKYTQKIGVQNNNNTNIGKQQNNNIQINNNIKLLAFGKEDMSHVVEEVYKRILNKGFKSVPTFVQYIHFNRDKPENHNVYISNMQTNYALVYDSGLETQGEGCSAAAG
jgi:hypothetical protein